MAARRGVVPLVQLLLRNGAAGDATSRGNVTALLSICGNPETDLEVMKLLLRAGASTQARTHDGRGTLHLVARGSLEAATLLLENGAQVNVVANDGSLPLHDAARERNCDLIALLVERRPELDKEDNTGAEAGAGAKWLAKSVLLFRLHQIMPD
jgi:ankyrin repeat protein